MNEVPEDRSSVCNENTNSKIYFFMCHVSTMCLDPFGEVLSHIHAYVKFLYACAQNVNLATDHQNFVHNFKVKLGSVSWNLRGLTWRSESSAYVVKINRDHLSWETSS